MYWKAPNWTVFTRLWSRSNRVGMTRGRSIPEPGEVGEELHAELVALLRVELRAVDVAGLDGRESNRTPYPRCSRVVGRGRVVNVVRVHEVEARFGRKPCGQRVGTCRRHEVPAHVRHFEAACSREPACLRVDPAEAGAADLPRCLA